MKASSSAKVAAPSIGPFTETVLRACGVGVGERDAPAACRSLRQTRKVAAEAIAGAGRVDLLDLESRDVRPPGGVDMRATRRPPLEDDLAHASAEEERLAASSSPAARRRARSRRPTEGRCACAPGSRARRSAWPDRRGAPCGRSGRTRSCRHARARPRSRARSSAASAGNGQRRAHDVEMIGAPDQSLRLRRSADAAVGAARDVVDEVARAVGTVAHEGRARGDVGMDGDGRDVDAVPSQPIEIEAAEIIVADRADDAAGMAETADLIDEDGRRTARETGRRGAAARESRRPSSWP